MTKNRLGKIPRYEEIAKHLAQRISEGEFSEGQRIHGRSTLAAYYHVSPETIRRALHLLQDQQVVSVMHGSGIRVQSRNNAQSYLSKVSAQSDFFQLHGELGKLIAERDKINRQINSIYGQIFAAAVSYMNHPKSIREIPVSESSVLYGEVLDPIKLWVDQGITVVSVKRNNEVHPPYKLGPIQEGDILIVIGSPNTQPGMLEELGAENINSNEKQS